MSTRMALALLRQRRTKRDRTCAQAQTAASEWQATFDSVTDIVALISPDFRLLRINQAGYQALGRKPEELIGRKCYEVVHGLNSPIAGCPCAETLRTGKAGVGEITQDGRYFRATAAPVWGRNRELVAFSHTIADITERKQAELALREREQEFRGCFEQSAEGLILTDEDGRVTGWNPGQELISGRKAADVLGKPIWDVILGMSPAAMNDPTNARLMQQGWQGLLATGALPYDGQPHESRIERPDGSGVEVQKVYFAIKSERGFRGGVFLRDISERKQMESALTESELKYRSLFESSSDAIILFDQEERFLECNPATLKMFGYSTREEFLGKYPGEVSPPNQPDGRESGTAADERMATAFREGRNSFEWIHRRADGTDFPAEVLLTAFDYHGRKVLQATVRDITERKQAEAALARKSTELAALNEQKNEFLGMAAHDLRNPLAVIMARSEFVLDGDLGPINPEQQKFIEAIKHSSEFMLKLINDLLDVARIEAGKVNLELEPTDLAELLRQNIALNQVLAGKKDIRLELEVAADLPTMELDAAKIEQVLNNLVSNAVKFSSPGSTVKIRAARSNGTVSISVADHGPGIPSEEIGRLFTAFGRTSVRNTTGEKDTGLGLLIVKRILEAHHGGIRVESEPGKGATFVVTLPGTKPRKRPEEPSTVRGGDAVSSTENSGGDNA
jgi:PAS domain S-box-containing protein